MTRTIIFLALTAVSTAFAAGGQVYKWTDAQGVVHYSDAPPPTTQANVQTVRVTGGDRPHDVPAPRRRKPTPHSSLARIRWRRTRRLPPIGPRTAPRRATTSNCCRANSRSCDRFRRQVRPLDDKTRQVQIADMNAQIAVYCK